MEHELAFLLRAHSLAKIIECGVHLLVHFLLALVETTLRIHSLHERDKLVEVQLDVRVALDRHFGLLEVLGHHVELGKCSPSVHDIGHGWDELQVDEVEALLLIHAVISIRADQPGVEQVRQDLFSTRDIALGHLFVTRVYHEVRVLIIFAEIKLLT